MIARKERERESERNERERKVAESKRNKEKKLRETQREFGKDYYCGRERPRDMRKREIDNKRETEIN